MIQKKLNTSFVPDITGEEMIYVDLFLTHSAVLKFLFSEGQWKRIESKSSNLLFVSYYAKF